MATSFQDWAMPVIGYSALGDMRQGTCLRLEEDV